MVKLGTLSFDTRLNAQAVQDAETIKKNVLHKLGNSVPLKIKVTFTSKDLRSDLQTQLSKFKPKVKVDILVDQVTASQAVQQALAKAGLTNNMTAGQLRAQRAAEIQQRMQLALARSQREAASAAREHSKSMVTLNSHFGNGITLGGRLSATVASIYSVYTLKNFMQSMIEIGGEFQKQRIALETMLGSLSRADVMYKRMKDLAVESPFTFMDLMSYTKQLKAFQIPYNELFETTKRLGDISAGLGVDMNRLILAFGQVRAAAFLRGQEVRQFTEAGIPLVDALARKFSELENRAVSAGEVFDKISKRQVSFGMVKDVLWELTDEGGQFYNMQSKLTESLSGKLDKLKDSYQIMVAEMAQGNNAVIGGMLDIFTKLVQYGDKVIGMLGTLTGAYLAYKAAVMALNVVHAVQGFIGAMKMATGVLNLGRALQGLTLRTWQQVAAQQALNLVSKANWIAIAATAITTVIGLYFTFRDETESLAKSTRELRAEIQEEFEAMDETESKGQELIRTMFNQTKSTDQQKAAYERLQALYPQMFSNMDFEQAKRKSNIDLLKMEAQAAREAMMAKLHERTTDAKSRKAKLKEGISMFYSDSGKYNIDSFEDQKKIRELVRENGGQDAVNAFNKLMEQYETINSELDELNKIREEVNKKTENAGKNRTSKWWNDAKKLAGEFASFAPKEDATLEDYQETIAKQLNSRKGFLDSLTENAENYADVKKEVDTLTNIYTAIGGKTESLSKFKPKGETKDPALEQAKTRLAEYQAFLSEYKKYREIYSKEKTISLLEDLFPNLEGHGTDIVDNYISVLDKLIFSEKKLTDARKKFNNRVNKTKADVQFEREAEEIKRFSSEMELALKRISRQWDIYKKIVDDTGDRGLAERLSGFAGTSKAEELRAKIQGMIPSIAIDYANVINMGDEQIEEYVKKLGLAGKMAQSVANALKEWRDAQMELRNEALDVYGKMIADAGGLSTEIDKINTQYDEQIRKLREIKELSPKELSERVNQTERSRKLDLADLFVNNIDFGQLFELLGKYAVETAGQVKNEVDRLISGSDVKALSQAELERYLKLRNTLNTVGGQKAVSPFSRTAWSELTTATSVFQATIKNVIAGIKDYIKAQKDEEEAIKDLENATSEEAGIKARQALEDARARKKESQTRIAQGTRDAKQQGQQLSEAQKHIIEGAQSLTDTMRQVFAGSLHDLTLGVLNIIKLAGGGKESAAGGAAGSIGEALAGLGVKSGNVYGAIIAAILQILDMLKDDATGFFRDLLDDIFGAIEGLLDDIGSGELIGAILGEVMEGVANALESVAGLVKNVFDGSFFSGIWDGISSAFDRDDTRQELIDASKKQIELLQRLNSTIEDRLGHTLGGVYTFEASSDMLKKLREKFVDNIKRTFDSFDVKEFQKDTMNAVLTAEKTKSYYDTVFANLLEQRDEIQYQMDLEEDKKHPDEEAIKDYRQQLDDIKDQIDTFAEDLAKTLYDIDVKSWASELGDALFDAWQKGEDGAEAFAKKARELLSDVTKNIVTTSIIETALQPVLDTIKSEMKGKEGKLDADSIGNFASKLGDVMEWLPETVNATYDAIDQEIQKRGLGSIKEEESSSSSAGAGIKGITEQTADLMSGYVNAMRADVSVIRISQAVHLPAIAASLQHTSVLAETQVGLQQQIAANTLRNADAADRIYDILHKIDIGATKIKMA